MNGYEHYQSVLRELMDKKAIKLYWNEILEILIEIDDIENLKYDKIVLILDKPKDFLDDFMSNRRTTQELEENVLILNIVRILNIAVYLIFPLAIIFLPYYETMAGSIVYSSMTTFELATLNSPSRLIFAIFIIIAYLIVLEYFQRKLLFDPINNLVSYFKTFLILVILLIALDIILTSFFVFKAFEVFTEDFNSGHTITNECQDFYDNCFTGHRSGSLDINEWSVTWIVLFQFISLMASMYYRIHRNGIAIIKYEEMERIEIDTKRYPSIIKWLYKINMFLIIGIYTPIYISLYLQAPIGYPTSLVVLIVDDILITVLIGIQLLLFSGLAYSVSSISEKIRDKEFSNSNNIKYQIIYVIYFISTIPPDYGQFNTDGSIVTTTILSVWFLLIMWSIEIPNKRYLILSFIPSFLAFIFLIEYIF